MEIVIDRPPILPPQDDRGRRSRFIIMPDITMCEHRYKTRHENCWTLHYFWMTKWDIESGQMWRATSDSRTYRAWLETYETKDGIPPHIQFGGAIETIVGGDPGFYDRWLLYARKTFC